MGRNVRHGRRPRSDADHGEAEATRAMILARLHRRGKTLEHIAAVLGSSKSTVHRRVRELGPGVLAELGSADPGAFI